MICSVVLTLANFYLNVFITFVIMAVQYELIHIKQDISNEYIGYVLAGILVLYVVVQVMMRKRSVKGKAYSIKSDRSQSSFNLRLNADKYKIVLVDKGSDEAIVFLDLAHRIIRRKKEEDII